MNFDFFWSVALFQFVAWCAIKKKGKNERERERHKNVLKTAPIISFYSWSRLERNIYYFYLYKFAYEHARHWSPDLPTNHPNFRFIHSMEIYIFVLKLTSFIVHFSSCRFWLRCVRHINSSTHSANSVRVHWTYMLMDGIFKGTHNIFAVSFQIKRIFPRHRIRGDSDGGEPHYTLTERYVVAAVSASVARWSLAKNKMPWPSNESYVEIRIESCFSYWLLHIVAFHRVLQALVARFITNNLNARLSVGVQCS